VTAKYPIARTRGFTLVEMVVFIVIFGIAAYALFRSFSSLLPRSPSAAQLTQATQLAQERMELILGQRDVRSYNNTVDLDPCNVGTPTVCTSTFGYAVSSAGTAPAPAAPPAGPTAWNGNPTTSYKIVSVTVRLGGTTLATQSAVLANYLP
jgi:prepilin-type N-terminal cleavage/methylation domain-containing protein